MAHPCYEQATDLYIRAQTARRLLEDEDAYVREAASRAYTNCMGDVYEAHGVDGTVRMLYATFELHTAVLPLRVWGWLECPRAKWLHEVAAGFAYLRVTARYGDAIAGALHAVMDNMIAAEVVHVNETRGFWGVVDLIAPVIKHLPSDVTSRWRAAGKLAAIDLAAEIVQQEALLKGRSRTMRHTMKALDECIMDAQFDTAMSDAFYAMYGGDVDVW